jgi:hypothetical protein
VSSKAQGDEPDDEPDDEDDWLLARERGQPGPAVSDQTVRRYAQLQSLIKDLPATPAGVASRVGWEQDVFAAIDAAEAEPGAPRSPASLPPPTPAAPQRMSRSRRWAAAAVSIAIAAGVVIAIAVYRHRGAPAVPTLAFEIEQAHLPHRTYDTSVGDTLIVRGVVKGQGELRVYGDAGVEHARCTGPAPDCTIDRSGERTALQLTMLLRAPGALRAVLFAAPLEEASKGLDADLEAARRAGIAMATLEPVEVH